MIHGFIDTVRQDAGQLRDFCTRRESYDAEQEQRVSYAAARMLCVLGMAFAAFIVVSGLTMIASASLGALLTMAFGVTLYAFCHDVFIIARNSEKNLLEQVEATVKGFFADVKDFVMGHKDLNQAPRQPVTEDTILRPLWDGIYAH